MRFKEIITRLTGLNLGPVGASWSPPEPEVSKAKRIITCLEDRRVLYNPESLEVPEHCVRPIIEIRHFLTDELSKAREDSPLTASLRGMRASVGNFSIIFKLGIRILLSRLGKKVIGLAGNSMQHLENFVAFLAFT
jgi:hypothetical protein